VPNGRVAATQRPLLGGLAAAAATAGLWLTMSDHADDAGGAMSHLPWLAVAVVVVLPVVAMVNFVCAAVAVRDLSDSALSVRSTTLVQLAAAATNRLVPNGLGGTAVNLRYLARSGVAPGAAVTAVAMLAVLGGLTDALSLAGVTALGPHVGVVGGGSEIATLTRRGLAGGSGHSWLVAAVAAGAVIALAARSRGRMFAGAIATLRQAGVHLGACLRRPRRLARAIVASWATTTVLSVGFVLAARAWGSAPSPAPVGALAAIYLVAAAAGGGTPLPAFCGVTEAALVGGLVLAHYSSGSALLAVAIFRGVTYWLPLPIGIFAVRQLRRERIL